jgi:hypothetical protein
MLQYLYSINNKHQQTIDLGLLNKNFSMSSSSSISSSISTSHTLISTLMRSRHLVVEFDSLITYVTTHIDPVSMTDLYGHLLTYEQRIEAHHSSPDLSLSSINAAQSQSASPPLSATVGRGYSSTTVAMATRPLIFWYFQYITSHIMAYI